MAIYMWREYVVPADALYFEANTANSTIRLDKNWTPTSVNIETSTDGATRTDYTIQTDITLANVWDKVYFRNKSETPTEFSKQNNYYLFVMSWSINASWDINYLLCKNSTDTLLWYYCFYRLFYNCSSLVTCPALPATTITRYCYNEMFNWCTNLETLPQLPALTLQIYCYQYMFNSCSKIKLSTSQTWEYQTEYRIPITWTGTNATGAFNNMFTSTWWTFTSNPSTNTTYYTSNQVI